MTCKYDEAHAIAKEIIDEILSETPDCSTDDITDIAEPYASERCDSHPVSIYYGRAIDFCATNDTSEGEQFLEDTGGISQTGDTFGAIACRVAFATLYCETINQINQMVSELEAAV